MAAESRRRLVFPGVLFVALVVRLIVAVAFHGSIDVGLQIMHGELILAGEPAWTSKLPIGNYLPAAMHWIALHWGVPAPVAQKLPAILADLLAAFLLYRIANRQERDRPWIWPAVYLLNPLTVMLSAYHANVDGLMAAAILWALDLRSRDRPVLAGIGAGSAILMKPTALLALPVLMLPLSRRRNWILGGAALVFSMAICAPFAWLDPAFGRFLSTYSGPYGNWGVSYGLRQLEYIAESVPGLSPEIAHGLGAVNTFVAENSQIFVATLMAAWLLYLFLRWRLDGFDENARGLASTFLWFYIITTGFGVQYLSLAFPFILIVSTRLAAVYVVALSPHVFDTYVQVAGDDVARAVAVLLTSEGAGGLALGVVRGLAVLLAWLACVWILWRLVRTREGSSA